MISVVIADDLSGAAELAGVAHQRGLKAEVQLDAVGSCSSDVIVVDANSRSLAANAAAEVMERIGREVLRWFGDEGIVDGWIYRKVDSVLRGPLASELQGLMRALDARRTVLVNANPRKHRTVQGGCLFVNGRPIHQTSFATDPEYPRHTMQVADLLSWPDGDLHFLDSDTVLPPSGLCVGNVSSGEEMFALTVGIKQALLSSGDIDKSQNSLCFNHKTVLAGAAEFYEALLANWFGYSAVVQSNSRLKPGSGGLLLSGTAAPAIIDTGEMQVLYASRMTAELEDSRIGVGDQARAERMHEQFIDLAVDSLEKCDRFQEVWIEGGRTASTLLRRMGWSRLKVEAVYADGVVGLRSVQGNSPHVVVKPGSYAWPR